MESKWKLINIGDANIPCLKVRTMNRFLNSILNSPPANAVRTACLVLFDAFRDICGKLKSAFAGGPTSELSEYFQMVTGFARRRGESIRARYEATREILSGDSDSESDRSENRYSERQ